MRVDLIHENKLLEGLLHALHLNSILILGPQLIRLSFRVPVFNRSYVYFSSVRKHQAVFNQEAVSCEKNRVKHTFVQQAETHPL